MSEEINNLKGIFANVNDDMLLRDCGNLYAENKQLQQENQRLKEEVKLYKGSDMSKDKILLDRESSISTLYKENQQLKEELEVSKQYEDYYKDLCDKALKTGGKYISVIKEIREYIKEHNDYLEKAKEMYISCNDELLKSTCIQLINNELVRSDNLLQILDKVKE